jgi:hypothetical protein
MQKAPALVAAVLSALLPVTPSQAANSRSAQAARKDSGANVILVTLDGVRWEEVFHGVDPGQSLDANPRIFSFMTGPLAKQGVLFGDRERGETVRVGNSHFNSLPGYQAIMAGNPQPCGSNLCGRISVETMQERILKDLELEPDQVAAIASWEKIANAVEHVEGTIFVNAGNRPLLPDGRDPLSADDQAINEQSLKDPPPWHDARRDKYTFAHAINYLKAKRPRFLFISLNDSDEWGHRGKYDQYLATLRQHDAWIHELVTTLDSMGEYGRRTTLIVTTDHGRGEGNDWSEHGSGYADSGNVWIYGRSPFTEKRVTVNTRKLASVGAAAPAASVSYSHLDIRPTIEATFGLEPKMDGVSPLPGHVIRAITGTTPGGQLPKIVRVHAKSGKTAAVPTKHLTGM